MGYPTRRPYGWIIVLLLLTFALVMPHLHRDGLWYDEVYSVINAGGAHFGPLSPAGIYNQVLTDDPHQALGYPYMLAAWGAVAGWTEFAGRYLSLLWALLTMVLTYRIGIAVSGVRWVGVLAALIVGLSSFTLYYAHELRAFTFAGFSAALLLLSYWHILKRKRVGLAVKAGYVLGAAGLFYAHYFAGILAVGIGLYHLIFVKKDRHWPQAALLGIAVVLLFLPQIPPFLAGFDRYSPEQIEKAPLTAWQVIEHLLYYVGNGAGMALMIVGLAGGIGAALTNRRGLRMVIGVTLASLLTLIALNEWLEILEPSRLRYAIFLWPPLAVWTAYGLYWLIGRGAALLTDDQRQRARWRGGLLLLIGALWVANGLRVYALPDFNDSINNEYVPQFRTLTMAMQANGVSPDDAFVFFHGTNEDAWHIRQSFAYATHDLPARVLFASNLFDINEENAQWARDQIAGVERVWYGINELIGFDDNHSRFRELLNEQFVACDTLLDQTRLRLELWARSDAFCPEETPLMRFGESITLNGAELKRVEQQLEIALGWKMTGDTPSDTYSVAIHITPEDDPQTITAQRDTGLTVAGFDAQRMTFDLADLPAGTYKLWLLVYDYRSGERLNGVRLRDDESGDRLSLRTITLE